MQTSSQLQLLPAVTDNATFYLVLQPKSSGLTNSMLVSTALTFNPSSNTFQLNGVPVGTGASSTPSSLQTVTAVGNTTTFGITTGGLTTTANLTLDATSGYVTIDGTSGAIPFSVSGAEIMRLTSTGLGIGTSSPSTKLEIAVASGSSTQARQFMQASGAGGAASYMRLTNTGADGVFGIADSGGSAIISGGVAYATQLYTVGSTPLQFGTNSTVRATIDSSGNFGIGTSSLTGVSLRISKNVTGSAFSYSSYIDGAIQSDVTSAYASIQSTPSTQAAAFTLGNLRHFYANMGTIGAGSTVTNQYGFAAENSLTGATNNYGFYGNIASATGRYNLYMAGTADNYIAGALGIGGTPVAGQTLHLGKNITGSVSSTAVRQQGVIQSDVTSSVLSFDNVLLTAASAFTLSTYRHYNAQQGTIGSGSAVTTQIGFHADSTLTGATNNYGFFGNIASAAGRYNLYMAGTADNYIAGALGIGGTPSANLTVVGTTLIQNSANTAGRGSTIIQATTATTAQTAIDTWSTTAYRTAKYLVQMTQGSNYHTIELLLLQNGTTAYLTQYGEVTTGTILGTFDASISGSTLSLLINPVSATSMTINLVRDTISV